VTTQRERKQQKRGAGRQRCAPSRTASPNYPVLVTAARLRFLLNLNGYVWAAARDGGR
jgi:hypothetical protein